VAAEAHVRRLGKAVPNRMHGRRIIAAAVFVAATAGCAAVREPKCMPGEQSSITDLLYFGTAKPNGVVTTEEWAAFLATSVTPRFPAGVTVWQASGQWRNENGGVVREGSFVLSLVHPDDHSSETAVRALAAEYKSRFNQDAVLRVKSHACVSF
jgi:hypothetical protein